VALMTNRHAPLPIARATLAFEQIVVIGGGCYGGWYTAQLARAVSSGALEVGRVVVVDRNAECAVAARIANGEFHSLPIEIAVRPWSEYLDAWLASGEHALAGHALVPSPLMPHVLLEWLVTRAMARWPSRSVSIAPLTAAPRVPWERAAPDGRHYVSFAEWLCPINCIEPSLCPATRGPRSWSMPPALAAFVAAQPAERVLSGPVLFHCVHRTHGVGMIDAVDIARADAAIAAWGASGALNVLVGTVSHCHGALGVLAIR
jgi:hypothetical protein